MAKYRIAFDIVYQREKERVKGILQTRAIDGSLAFKNGLNPEEIAQQLVGVGGNRKPSKEYSDMIEVACDDLVNEGLLTKEA